MESSINLVIVNSSSIGDQLGLTLATFSVQYALYNVPNPVYGPTIYHIGPYEIGSRRDGLDNLSPFIFEDACQQADRSLNCSASCSSTGTIFENLYTLHNCMVYQTIANQHAASELTSNAGAVVDRLQIAHNTTNLTDSSQSLPMTRQIQSCLIDYCQSLSDCPDAVKAEYYDRPSPLDPNSTFDLNIDLGIFIQTICGSLPTSMSLVNSDIGGIGVYVSYWIQAGLAILAFLTTMTRSSWLYYSSGGVLRPFHGLAKANEKAQRVRVASERHLSRLTDALTDFGKAQCFFMLAINIAAQVVIRRGGLQPQSLQQIYNNYIFIKFVAISGYLTITFTLYNLHLLDKVSWYLLVLSFGSIAMSIATLITIGNFNPSNADMAELSSYASKSGPESCGSWQPGAYCLNILGYESGVYDMNTATINAVAFRMLAFCLVVFGLLVAEKSKILRIRPARQLLGWLDNKLLLCLSTLVIPAAWLQRGWNKPLSRRGRDNIASSYANMRQRCSFPQPPKSHRCLHPLTKMIMTWKESDYFVASKKASIRLVAASKNVALKADYVKLFRKAFVVLMYMTLTGFYIYWFETFYTLLYLFNYNGYLNQTWNFGQVVAITVWAPPICEYLYLELRGMKHVKDKEKDTFSAGLDEGTPMEDWSPLQHRETPNPGEEYTNARRDGEYVDVDNDEHERSADHEEEDITWRMSDFQVPPTEPLSYDR